MTRQTRSGRVRAALGRFGALALVTGLTACGGGSTTPTPPPVTNPPPAVRSVIGNYTFSLGAIGLSQPVEITVTGTGTVDATAQWTFSSNDVDLFLTDRNCSATSIFNLGNCNVMSRADSFTSKPEVIRQQLSTGVYRLWVYNDGPGSESGTLVVGFTP
jgi:hypothetical protein